MTLYPKDGDNGGQKQGAAAVLPHGTLLAQRYRVERRLGAGGMGAVYEVMDQALDEPVALKLLHPDLSADEEHRQRLRGEVRLARRVSHPNVCRVHDLGEHEGQLFVTMELVRGPSLRANMKAEARSSEQVLPLPRRIDIVVQICSALSAAHKAGVLHRDVKPDNVVIERHRVVLTDFGVAGLMADLAHNRRLVAGTPAYIAPEVLRGERYDHRVDVYATAVVAFELLASRQPFQTPSLDAAIQRARTRPPVPPLPPIAEPEVVALLDQVLGRALEYDAAVRTRSVDLFAEELGHAMRGHKRPASRVDTPVPLAYDAPTMASELSSADEPTVTAASAGPAAASAIQRTTSRSQVRVATALSFACRGEKPSGDSEAIGDSNTRPITLAAAGDRFERLVVDLGGTPLAVSATGITALFGAPFALGDDASRAARAAHGLLDIAEDGRAGIDTGRLLYRRADSSGAPAATGEALIRAGALLREAQPGEVLASPPAARQLAGRFQVSELPASRTVDDGGRALLIHPGTLERPEIQRAMLPILGRDAELAQLEALLHDCFENRQPRWACVTGPAGFGKSRLRMELMRRVDEHREVAWLVGRSTPLGEVAALSLLRSAEPAWFEAASRAGASRRESFAAARAWLEERAARRPVVVLLEDLQWADDASLELFETLCRELDELPVTVIAFGRSDAGSACLTAPGIRTVELGPLDDRAARELAHRIAPAATADELRELVRRAGGNPFFIEELARDQRERGQTMTTVTPTSTITPLPATVEAVVQGRLDRLPPRAREVACGAAVVGREFWREAARAALRGDIDDAELDAVLAELEHRAIVAPLPPTAVDDERYIFSSELVRDVAYQQLSPRDRRTAHAAVARWLEPRVGDPETADPAVLAAIASHHDLAGDSARARDAYRAAGRRSMALFAFKEASLALRRARELSDEPAAELLELLGDALMSSDSIEAAESVLQEALGLVAGDPLSEGRILDKLSTCATRRADNDAAIDYCQRGLSILAPNDELTDDARRDPTVVAALYGSMAWLRGYVMTDNEVGLSYGERAVALLESTPHRRELARALSRLGANYMRAGRWADQLSCNQRNLSLAEELGDLMMQLTAHINLGVTYSSLGDYEAAARHTRSALELGRRTNALTVLALVHSNLGGWLLDLDQLDEAGEHLDRAVELSARVGNRRFLPECNTFAARLALRRGDLAGAEERARQALALATDTSVTIDEGIAARVLGGVLALAGRFDEAREMLARSQACLADSDDYEAAKTTAQTARMFALRGADGDPARATGLREQARAVFERLGAGRDLARLDDDREVR